MASETPCLTPLGKGVWIRPACGGGARMAAETAAPQRPSRGGGATFDIVGLSAAGRRNDSGGQQCQGWLRTGSEPEKAGTSEVRRPRLDNRTSV